MMIAFHLINLLDILTKKDYSKFKINQDKTHTFIFNTALSKDVYPKVINTESDLYENKEEFKILGLNLSSDKRKGINMNTYIEKCIQKAYSKLWILRRLVEAGVSIENLVLTYNLRIRVHIEQNVPLWMFSFNNTMKTKIEKLQKISVFIILGKHAHTDYLCNLAILDMEPLDVRREKMALKFARKILKHLEHRQIFTFKNDMTRTGKTVIVPKYVTSRYRDSTVPSLAKLINEKLAHRI